MTRTMKIDYDEKDNYGSDLIKRAQFLQRSATRARVLDAFLAQVSDFYDKETADSIFKQIDSLQYQLWQKEVDRVTKAVKTRKQNNSNNKDDDSEQSDNSSDSDDNDDDKTDKSDRYNGIITVDKSKTKFYPKQKNHQNHQKKQHAHNKRRNQNHQQ